MMKLRFDFNSLLANKLEDQKVTLPIEKELNEQELAIVTGGGGKCGCDDDWHRCRHSGHKRHHRHHRDD
jgi:hypothetical protein